MPPYHLRMRAALLTALAVAALAAADKEPDPKAQAKTLWTEAAMANDLWTCLQLEEWAREQKPAPRLPSALGSSAIIGSALFAFPEAVRQFADAGDRLLVCTSRRLYAIAPDGRPLRRSLPLKPQSEYPALGYGGQVVASVAIERERRGQPGTAVIGTMLCDGGKAVLATRYALGGDQRWSEDMAVADDGSAVALVIHDANAEGPRSRIVAVCSDGPANNVTDMRSAIAVGRKGAWLVGNSGGRPTLVRGDRRQQVASPAAGPGMLACISEGKGMLVLADASDRPLDPGRPLGRDPALATVGGWLALGCGDGAKGASQGDLLGDGGGSEVELPSQVALWRWEDLAKDPAAKPAKIVDGYLSPASDQSAAILLWQGKAVDMLDLSGHEPQRSHRFDAPIAVSWAYADQHALVVMDAAGTRMVFGPDKSELFAGKCEDLTLRRRDLASYWTPGKAEGERRWHLQRLSSDPAKRQSVDLQLDPVGQDIEVGYRLYEYAVGRHDGEWRRVGLDGKLIDQGSRNGPDPKPRPPTDGWWGPTGRFYVDGPHLVPKTAGPPAEPLRRLVLQDAWRFAGTTMLLDDERRLFAVRRRGDAAEVGHRPDADRFGLAGRQAALLASDAHPVALIGTSGLVTRIPDSGKVEEMPAGPWRLDDSGRFTAPRGRQLVWDGERIGFSPVRLRSPDDAGLFVVTAPLVIELDPEAARLIGKEP